MRITRKIQRQIKTWVNALRSGKFSQATGFLQSKKGFCCLGVACKVLVPRSKLKIESNRIEGELPEFAQPNTPKWLQEIDDDFADRMGANLSNLNDSGVNINGETERMSFDEIADLVEAVYIHKVNTKLKLEEESE